MYKQVNTSNAVEAQKEWAEKFQIPTYIENCIGMRFILIPPGEFMMGAKGVRDSQSIHMVKITNAFYIGIYPVTQHQWEKIIGWNPSHFKGSRKYKILKNKEITLEDNPVESVSWDDVQNFIGKLNNLENTNKYRLPTEAEWEYACRAGSTSKYCFGDSENQLSAYAWYFDNSVKRTHPVGELKPNRWGLYDMHGNVWEWCEDWAGDYPPVEATDPLGHSSDSLRINRGGGWNSDGMNCTSACRNNGAPNYRFCGLGFRLVRPL